MCVSEDNENTKKKSFKKKNPIAYVLGSVALFAAACVVIPVAMDKVAGILYKAMPNTSREEDDDWGPVIEKKNPTRNISAEGEDKEEQ